MMTHIATEASISSVERASLAYQTLVGLTKTGIRYCLWKSFDSLKEGIRGDSDFDILVGNNQRQEIFNFLRQNGWFEVYSEPWRRLPDVYDFFQYDPRYKKFIHFHVHFKLVMGEKLVKSLVLPLESLFLETAEETEGIFHAMPELEICAYVLRLPLRIGWRDYARIIRRRNGRLIYKYLIPRFEQIHKRCDRAKLETLLDHPSLSFIDRKLVLEAFDDIYSLDYYRSSLIKRYIAPHRRYGNVTRFFVHLYRTCQKTFYGQGKTFPKHGLSFAFCGPDGSGKTTLVDCVEKLLSQHFKVARFYMGGNNSSRDFPRWLYSTFLRKPFFGVRKICRILNYRQGVGWLEQLYYGFTNYLIAREKYNRYRRSKIELEKGAIVLFERFPLFKGFGDGVSVSGSAYYEEKEQQYFNKINPPNIIFVLQVDAEEAIQRKPDHLPNVIRNKTTAFDRFVDENQVNPKLVSIDANASLDVILATILDQINGKLRNDN